MRYLFFILMLTGLSFLEPQRKKNIFLVGDSTMSEKRITAYPETGWGMPFKHFFDTSTTIVDNHAQNGRSSKTFLSEDRWRPIMQKLQQDDLVLIQFGHNDEVPSKPQATTEAQFQENLRLFVNESRARKAVPVLVTPAARRKFDSTGGLMDTHKVYAELVRKVAKSMSVPLIELDKKSQDLLKQLGPEQSRFLFNHLAPGQHPNYPGGISDDTHFNELGARMMAEIVYSELKELNPGGIVKHFK